ncbi:hypothetical protein C0991_001836 [Blastosporella zonata]|nr:hypothetical protein C0991_001836 [Blastosporella zonata]
MTQDSLPKKLETGARNATLALSYLDAVKLQFQEKPEVYSQFLDIMKDFNAMVIDTSSAVSRVAHLFRGNPVLLHGFNVFLPEGYHIDISDPTDPNTVTVTTPQETTTQNPFTPTFPGAVPIIPLHVAEYASPSHTQTAQTTAAASVLDDMESNPTGIPAEFNHAIQYIKDIKARFLDDVNTYKQFLDILQPYMKEESNIQEVYVQIQLLFKDSPDLVADFKKNFLREVVESSQDQGIAIQPQPVAVSTPASITLHSGDSKQFLDVLQTYPKEQEPQTATTIMSTSTSTKMQYVRLGNSGLKVSRLILGTMSYGSSEWEAWVKGEEEGLDHIKLAYDAGVNAFDTANVYSNGLSEEILGKAIKKFNLPREEIVVMTKVFFTVCREPSGLIFPPANPDDQRYVNQYGLSRKHIFDSVRHSLKRLQLDYIDVLQCAWYFNLHHVFQDLVLLAQAIVLTLTHLFRRRCKLSTTSSNQEWSDYAIQHNLTPFISMQNFHNLAYREEEREMMPTLKYFGVGSIPWSPLGRGVLTRPLREKTDRSETDRWAQIVPQSESTKEIVKRVEEIAKKKQISMAQVAIAWSLSKDGKSSKS